MKKLLPFLFALCGWIQAANLTVGTAAPPLDFRGLLQAPIGTGTNWQALKGNAVVLEFWATWCPGCRAQISHLNRLQQQFRDKPVRFISVTDEEPELVQRFLKDYSIAGWIALDSQGQTFSRYGVIFRPTTVLVDAEGIVRGIGNPSDLTADTVEALLDRRTISFSRDAVSSAAQTRSLPAPFFEMMIRPAGPVAVTGFSPGAISGATGKQWQIWGVPLRTLLSDAYRIPEPRVDLGHHATVTESSRYDVTIATPELTEIRRSKMLQELLTRTFQLKTHQELRSTSVYFLQRRPAVEPKIRPAISADSSQWGTPGDITALAMPITRLVALAQKQLGSPVVDESGLRGKFDFQLKWNSQNPQSFISALNTQLALQLIPSKRNLEYLIVDSAQDPKAW